MNDPLQKLSGDALTNSGQANDIRPSLASETSRRSFLGRGIAAAAVPATLVAGSSLAQAATKTPFPSYYTGTTERIFQEIQVDEFNHVNIIKTLITSLGGTPRPQASFTGISNLTASQFLATSTAFENTGVSAYLGAILYISNPQIVAYAAEIALVEAYHAGFLNSLSNVSLIPGGTSLTAPFTIPQVINAITPYVTNLNDNGAYPPVFSTTPSAANDIAILNFALLLEMLESEFYYNNVAVFYPS